jgi:hypothetical protein
VETDDCVDCPLSIDGTASITQGQVDAYNRIWVANRSDIETHLAYFESLNNGTVEEMFPDGYIIPDWIWTWPAHGNPEFMESEFLAPFIDIDSDQNYSPEDGDYPYFLGDQSLYFIINDSGGEHLGSGGEPLGVEIHVQVYVFDSSAVELENSVFVNYKIVNRSSTTYSDCYAGLWTDLDIGNSTDDYIGCDVKNGMYYAYNSDAFDEQVFSSLGYGEQTPVQAIAWLGGPKIENDGLDNELPENLDGYEVYGPYGPGYGDSEIDNERLGMTSFMYYNSGGNPINGDPTMPNHYYNYMKSTYKNGVQMKHGGNGVSGPGVTDTATSYFCPGDSDPLFLGTEGNVVDIWDEPSAGNPGGDRRGISAAGPFIMEPGELVSIDVAYMFTEETTSGFEELQWMQNVLAMMRGFYDESIFEMNDRLGAITALDEINRIGTNLLVFPNPTNSSFRILNCPKGESASVKIYSVDGLLVKESKNYFGGNEIDISNLPPGVYSLRTTIAGIIFSQKIIKIG